MASNKLAGTLWHYLSRELSKYRGIRWVSMAHRTGPLTRANVKGGDYYAVLRQSTVPAVIVESLFINNVTEERLLRRPDVQKSIAVATAEGVRDFVTEGGAAKATPYTVKPDKAGGLPKACVDPS
jgi:N-acetylmuramoyl-L-alanine amidase